GPNRALRARRTVPRGTAARRHRPRRARGRDDRGLPRLEEGARAKRAVPGRREPRRRGPPLRPRVRAPARAAGDDDARRMPRDPRALRAQCRRRIIRPRRACTRHSERDAVPLRRACAPPRRGAHRRAARVTERHTRAFAGRNGGDRQRKRRRRMTTWTATLMVGVTAIWIMMASAVAYLA